MARSLPARRSPERLLARALALFGFGVLGAGALGFSACQSIVGIEERVLDEQSVLCREYCDTVMANCTGDNAVYTNDTLCMLTCAALDPGGSEPTGNNVQCRLQRAKAAASRETPTNCRHAGPGGDGGPCGSDCEAWCGLLEKACPDEFAKITTDCVTSCENLLVDQKSFDLERDYYGGDTIECRLVHTTVAFEDPTVHCSHAGFIPDAMCVTEDAEPTCETLCRTSLAACPGELAVWESEAQCLTVCALFDLGEPSDTLHPSVSCRIYHAVSAGTEFPEFHCPHAGPTGEGMCGPGDADVSGTCQNYCLILDAACAEHVPDSVKVGDEDLRSFCETRCMTDLANKGAQPVEPGYSLARSESGDTLMCRTRQAIRALEAPAEAADLCEAAFGLAAPCQ